MNSSARSLRVPLVAAVLTFASGVGAVSFDWATVGDPGNACDPQPWGCFGNVDAVYRIAEHEVTNLQYVEFLNAKAQTDALGLYNPNMATGRGGIVRSGGPGSYQYSLIAGRETLPVNFVSVFDAMRFVNWVHNGQGDGNTETGAYTMPPNAFGVPPGRNPGAWIFLPTNDEWFKAAYYDPSLGVFFDYPAGSDSQIVCSVPTSLSNTANCGGALGDLTPVGSYPGSSSPSGSLDQAGNLQEWTETEVEDIGTWFIRGGSFALGAEWNQGSRQDDDYPDTERSVVGFRVASLEVGANGTECGDSVCEGPENSLTCSADCPEICGDGVCSIAETPANCLADCPSVCGDQLCTGNETVNSCFVDCGFCGDGVCIGWENATTCPIDCAPVCGDDLVEGNERCEAGVPLGNTCMSLGFDDGMLNCDPATCQYDTSRCTENQCLPKRSFCWSGSQCCSGRCSWFRCR